ncbi:MAG TPA: hypothetical protein VF503_12210 [Sphingobium sp.]|uniref:hypothetical protein n=1 Tax=Sphingobium sp. TaxID=1912891 RepID=UPI002ED166A5
MPSAYLQGDDKAAYGVPDATDQQIAQASTIVDGYLKREEGLVWVPDVNGLPSYMAAKTPRFSMKLAGTIAAGSAPTIDFPFAAAGGADLEGEVIVIDRDKPNLMEAVSITAIDTQNAKITLSRCVRDHDWAATLETGLCIEEERAVAPKRSQTRLSRSPVVRLVSGMGRYSFGRRSDQVAGLYNDVNLLAAVQTFGGPPMWVSWDVTLASVSVATGEVWVPAGLLIAYYSEVRIRYLAGYSAAALPATIKQATANIIAMLQQFGYDDAPPAFKRVEAGGTKLERWSDSMLDADTKALLEPFRPKVIF